MGKAIEKSSRRKGRGYRRSNSNLQRNNSKWTNFRGPDDLVRCTGPRPLDRMPLKYWLYLVIDLNAAEGVVWVDKNSLKFKIPWKHMSRSTFDRDRDMQFFEMYAKHSGKQTNDRRTWKTNFRCAINSLRDIERVKNEDKCNDDEAYRVFRFKEDPSPELPKDIGTETVNPIPHSPVPENNNILIEEDAYPEFNFDLPIDIESDILRPEDMILATISEREATDFSMNEVNSAIPDWSLLDMASNVMS